MRTGWARRRGAAAAVAVLGIAIPGCAAPAAPTAAPPTSQLTTTPAATVTPTPLSEITATTHGGPRPTSGVGSATARAPATPAWRLGATPLPRRPDGFGVVLATPTALVDRRLPTLDRLPPPPDGRFTATVSRITPEVRRRMGQSWQPGCPVGLDQLRYLTVSFRGFDARAHTGELVVNARVASQVVGVFRALYTARFPVEEMRLIGTADLTAAPTGDGNNTAAFVCRRARGQTRWSAHAYGLAIDVDPFQNPFSRADLVLPELASAYLDRTHVRSGMILPGGLVVRAFRAAGWTWGGTFRRPRDLMHFSATGN